MDRLTSCHNEELHRDAAIIGTNIKLTLSSYKQVIKKSCYHYIPGEIILDISRNLIINLLILLILLFINFINFIIYQFY